MTRSLTLGLGLCALLLGLLTASPATAGEQEVGMCTDGGPRPCVVSVLRNGAPLDEDWTFLARYSSYPAASTVLVAFYALRPEVGFDLGFDSLDDTWQVALDLGDVVPRGVFGSGRDVIVEREGSTVTVTGHPVTVSGQCDPDGHCPEWAEYPDPDENDQWDGYFGFLVSELPFEEADLLEASYGLDVFSNVASASLIPEVRHDSETGSDYLVFRLANRHYYEDGTTVVHGRLEVRIPNQLLRVALGIPDPELMTADSLDPVVTGHEHGAGTISVSQEPGGDAMLVRITGVTFSRRTAQVRLGVIRPTQPRDVRAERMSGTRARVDFDRARPRGAKVRGHEVRCLPVSGSRPAVTAWGRSPVTVTGLARGAAYDCRVRGISRAGAGPWSKAVALPRR